MTQPCSLFTDLSEVEAIECSGHRHRTPKKVAKRGKITKSKKKKPSNIKTVKAQFKPLCYLCRPYACAIDRYGWGYLNEEEAKLITLVRRTKLLRELIIQAKKACKDKEDGSLSELDPNRSDLNDFHDSDYSMEDGQEQEVDNEWV